MNELMWAVPVVTSLVMMFIFNKNGKDEAVSTEEKKDIKTIEGNPDIYKVDPDMSKLEWIGKKVVGKHNGTVDISFGELVVNENMIESGKFEIDLDTIKVLDLEDPELNGKLTGHLKSDDFFSAEKFPKGIFEITETKVINESEGYNYNIDGNLTIKGITKSISFPAKVKIDKGILTANANFDIDRTRWDIRYGSGKFFQGLGDSLISDKFNVSFEITAIKS